LCKRSLPLWFHAVPVCMGLIRGLRRKIALGMRNAQFCGAIQRILPKLFPVAMGKISRQIRGTRAGRFALCCRLAGVGAGPTGWKQEQKC
jgi:hypothetical protein